MNEETLKKLLTDIKSGKTTVDKAVKDLKTLPFTDLGDALIDNHRSLRQGFPEVIFGEGKTLKQIKDICTHMTKRKDNILISRIDKDKANSISKAFKNADYNESARMVFIKNHPVKKLGKGKILIITAGTSDKPVAEEAFVTASVMGNDVKLLSDVGVAGIHRLLHNTTKINDARVLIVVAGMEGALPSVVAGLTDKPVIAVPTSVGYGANLGGLTPMMAMLTSCAAGITVVNIDNGFGAAVSATLINRL